MSTEVFVQRDGIVNHRHSGAMRWHDPSAKHQDETLHVENDAAHPTNLKDLNAEERKQYREALAGKSFYGLYRMALAGRREERAKVEAVREAEEALAADITEVLDELLKV